MNAPVLLRRAAPAGARATALAHRLAVLLASGPSASLVAACNSGSWRQELTRTLLQLNADAQFRARVQSREAVDPEWYRRKALALLSATERLQQRRRWTLFVPGSWRPFDDLEEQVQARLAREFGDIVVETMRRELYARASQLTGVPLVRGTGDLQLGARLPVAGAAEPGAQAHRRAPRTCRNSSRCAEYVPAVEQLDDGGAGLPVAAVQRRRSRSSCASWWRTRWARNCPARWQRSVRMFQGRRRSQHRSRR